MGKKKSAKKAGPSEQKPESPTPESKNSVQTVTEEIKSTEPAHHTVDDPVTETASEIPEAGTKKDAKLDETASETIAETKEECLLLSKSTEHVGELKRTEESGSHSELEALKAQLETIETERDEIQDEYDSLLEKVGTIKQRLGERFKVLEKEAEVAKADAKRAREEADAVRSALNEKHDADTNQLEAQLVMAREEVKSANEVAETAHKQIRELEMEIESLKKQVRDAQNELKATEKELRTVKPKLTTAERDSEVLKKQLVSQKIMFDQESSNEQAIKEALELKVEQLKTSLESAKFGSDQHLRRCEIQEEQIRELNEQLAELRTETASQTSSAAEAERRIQSECDQLRKDLERERNTGTTLMTTCSESTARQTKLESEAKETQLLIGKLRHEAVILNDHLTNALRLVRKDSKGSIVDKELVSNLFVQYATCPRQDTKKFEILMLIANFLDWDEQRRQCVGLEREDWNEDVPQQTQMVGMVGKLAEFLENRRSK